MEQEKKRKKRTRELYEDEAESAGSSFENHDNNNNKAKKRDVNYGLSFMKKENNNNNNNNNKDVVEEKGGCYKGWDSSHLALGVFDFPWLKDGVMISNSEDCNFLDFEDSFLFKSLERHETSFKEAANAGGIDYFSEECGLYESPMAHIPKDKLVEEDVCLFESNGLELQEEDVDCVWRSLLNKPL